MSQAGSGRSPIAVLRVERAGVLRSAHAALAKGPSGDGLNFAAHGLGSRLAVRPPRNVCWTQHISFSVWESEAALDRSGTERPVGEAGSAWSARLRPLRVYQKDHVVIDPSLLESNSYEGPVVSVTVSEASARAVPRFLRASRPVEQQVLRADGLRWAMGFFMPPLWFATVTMWRSSDAADAFAYSSENGGAHHSALPRVNDWFRRSTTMRFRPLSVAGSLSGDPPLDRSVLSHP